MTIEDNRTPREVGEQAISQLQQRRWIKGDLHDNGGAVCGMGAIYATRLSDKQLDLRLLSITAPEAAFVEAFGECHDQYSVAEINDTICESKEDMIDHFNTVIKYLIEKEEKA